MPLPKACRLKMSSKPITNIHRILLWVSRTRLRIMAALALAFFFLWGTINLAIVTDGAADNRATHADVIIVLGCKAYENDQPAPCIRARSHHAAQLYREGLARQIIASGGPSLEGPAEAGVIAGLLKIEGVPGAAIVEEDRSHNTIQNILNSQVIMRERGWRTAVIITEPYHINRAMIIARDAGVTAYPSPATDSPDWQDPKVRVIKLAEDALKLMFYQIKASVGSRG